MKQVEASAKTREEAIQNALTDLGVEMYEVDKIEVLDEGSKGLFGFGARPVKVRLVVENMPDEPQRDEEEDRPRRGRGRGKGGQNRDNRENRESRGETRERSGNREGRGRKRGKRDESKGGDNDDTPRDNQVEKSTGSRRRRDENGETKARNDRDGGRKRGESQRAKSDKPRNQSDRDATPDHEKAPRAESAPAPENGNTPEPDGLAADIIEPISDAQGNEAVALLEEIISKMGIEASATFTRSDDGSARLNVSSEDSAILIGRKGRNLSAMQYLINRMISQGDTNENTERLVVDVEGYVDRRRETLQEMATSMAQRAKETNRNMRLKPLSPQERRIIHLTLQDDDDIRTFSLGESLYRSVVISPKGAEKPERNRNNRGSRGGRGNRGGRRRGGRGRGDNRPDKNRADQDVDAGTFGD